MSKLTQEQLPWTDSSPKFGVDSFSIKATDSSSKDVSYLKNLKISKYTEKGRLSGASRLFQTIFALLFGYYIQGVTTNFAGHVCR